MSQEVRHHTPCSTIGSETLMPPKWSGFIKKLRYILISTIYLLKYTNYCQGGFILLYPKINLLEYTGLWSRKFFPELNICKRKIYLLKNQYVIFPELHLLKPKGF